MNNRSYSPRRLGTVELTVTESHDLFDDPSTEGRTVGQMIDEVIESRGPSRIDAVTFTFDKEYSR